MNNNNQYLLQDKECKYLINIFKYYIFENK